MIDDFIVRPLALSRPPSLAPSGSYRQGKRRASGVAETAGITGNGEKRSAPGVGERKIDRAQGGNTTGRVFSGQRHWTSPGPLSLSRVADCANNGYDGRPRISPSLVSLTNGPGRRVPTRSDEFPGFPASQVQLFSIIASRLAAYQKRRPSNRLQGLPSEGHPFSSSSNLIPHSPPLISYT
jgi:hypothetical protein